MRAICTDPPPAVGTARAAVVVPVVVVVVVVVAPPRPHDEPISSQQAQRTIQPTMQPRQHRIEPQHVQTRMMIVITVTSGDASFPT
jgi:hypothetical protein